MERFHQEEYLSKNKVNDFDDFKTKIKKESLLTGFTLGDGLMFLSFEIVPHLSPKVSRSLFMKEDLYLRQKLCCLTKSIAPGAASFGYDEDEETPKTVLCFMITGIASSYCDIVCMVPLSKYRQLL